MNPWRAFLNGFPDDGCLSIGRPRDAFHGHKGFNWRALRDELVQRWQLVRIYHSPVPFLPVDFNSQILFHLRKPGNGERCPTTSQS